MRIADLKPIGKGLIGFVAGYAVGAGLMTVIRLAAGMDPWDLEVALAGGYLFGLTGWVLGVGVWDYWAKPWFGKELKPYVTKGQSRYFDFDTDHKVIGKQYLVTFIGIFILAGAFAMVMRLELMNPGRDIMGPSTYNSFMSLHGTMMVFVAVAGIVGAFGNYFVPIMIGADDMAFPKLNALSYWLIPPVILFLAGSLAAGGYDTGWTGYAPLSVTTGTGALFFNLAFFTVGLSSIVGALNIIATTIKMRAPGLTWFRLPIFAWSIFLTACLALIFTQFIGLAMIMVVLDRVAGTSFFGGDGNPLLYQHIFWFYSHPAVYVMILPAFGAALEIIAHFSRKALFAYRWAVGGMLGITSLSAVVWAHHMFTSGMPQGLLAPFLTSTELISIPTGLIFLTAIGTLWEGKIRLTTPMLFAIAVIFNFVIGGITGVFVADVPVDLQLHDTYFVVAHFHYTIVGGGIFGLFAAIYYWFPKMTGRVMNERLGKVHFWAMFLGFNGTFLPMFRVGMMGMNRRIADYPEYLADSNRAVSIAGFFLGASFLIFLWNWISSWRSGAAAGNNPWHLKSVEWTISSPPPLENFDSPPMLDRDPYPYDVEPTTGEVVAP